MDRISDLLEQIATISIELSSAIDSEIENDTDRFALLTKANALDYEVHEIRQHLGRLNR